MKQHKEQMKQQQKHMEQHKERMKQYKLDSALSKYNIIADSLILKSASYINFVNWDSIASKFGKDMDSLAYKLGVGWDEIMERYDFE
jgi:hypothetical protein